MAHIRLTELRAHVRAEITAWANVLGWFRFHVAFARGRKDRTAHPFTGLMRLAGLLLLACATACAVEATAPGALEPVVEADGAAAMLPQPDAAPASMPDAHPATRADAAHSDALPARAEASADGGMRVPLDAGREADAAPKLDGGAEATVLDARALNDGAVVDAGTDNRVCLGATPSCDSSNEADEAIRAQFAQRQFGCTDGARMCGSVNQGGTGPFTYPLVCRNSIWRLGGVEYLPGEWIGLFECSRGCGTAPQICDP